MAELQKACLRLFWFCADSFVTVMFAISVCITGLAMASKIAELHKVGK